MNLKPYPEYKDSGVPWLGKVPKEWETRKTKYLFNERVEKGYPNETLLAATQTKGVVPKTHYEIRTVIAQKDLHNLKLVKKNDFVISLRSFQGGIELAYFQGIISPAYTIMIPKEVVSVGFFKHLAKSKVFIKLLTACVTGIREGQNIDYEILKRNKLPIPLISEQTKITRFLDYKALQIARFIKAKKRMIELLKEQKQVIINDVVTGKIDVTTGEPYPKYNVSDIEWLGKVPEGWEVKKLRVLLKPIAVRNRPDLPLLSVVREKGIIIRDINDFDENHNFIPDDLSNYKVVKNGQFAMNKMKAWQGSYGISNHEGVVSPAYYVFDLNFKNNKFFNLAIRSRFYVGFFGQASDGIRIGQWDMSLQRMKEIPFLIPPDNIMKQIVDFIPNHFKSIELAISRVDREISLIQEYRDRLIADVVTGKVDVRDFKVPDVEEEIIETIDEDEQEENIIKDEEE